MNTGITHAIVLLAYQGSSLPVVLTVQASVAEGGCRFADPCPLTPAVLAHIEQTLVPVARALVLGRGGAAAGWDLSFRFPASVQLRGERIECDGHSADVAVVLAMVSAALRVPILPDVAMTGQITESAGHVAMVRGLDAKLQLNDASIRTVIVPDWQRDPYFRQTYPAEFIAVRAQVKATDMRVVPVADVAEAFAKATEAPVESVPKASSPVAGQPITESIRVVEAVRAVPEPISDADHAVMHRLMTDLSEEHLTAVIDAPIDERLAIFTYATGIVATVDEFFDAVGQLLVHLGVPNTSAATLGMEITRLVEAAYSLNGGMRGALADARSGSLRAVFLAIAHQLKHERRQAHVRGSLLTAIDPLDAASRLRLARALLAQHAGLLPADVVCAEPEQFANSLSDLVVKVVSTRSTLNRAFSYG